MPTRKRPLRTTSTGGDVRRLRRDTYPKGSDAVTLPRKPKVGKRAGVKRPRKGY